ncbi:MAG: hypothetical protein GC131_09420 [Alphaproteobacteria bacterium]|nr:hypothetical protein [Alphaproteobacteria bacterium]
MGKHDISFSNVMAFIAVAAETGTFIDIGAYYSQVLGGGIIRQYAVPSAMRALGWSVDPTGFVVTAITLTAPVAVYLGGSLIIQAVKSRPRRAGVIRDFTQGD